jgi:hypothetical protein
MESSPPGGMLVFLPSGMLNGITIDLGIVMEGEGVFGLMSAALLTRQTSSVVVRRFHPSAPRLTFTRTLRLRADQRVPLAD